MKGDHGIETYIGIKHLPRHTPLVFKHISSDSDSHVGSACMQNGTKTRQNQKFPINHVTSNFVMIIILFFIHKDNEIIILSLYI